MTRLALFDRAAYETDALATWQADHPDIDLVITTHPLTPQTVALSEGCAAVSIQPVGAALDPSIYAELQRRGVRALALRTTGFDAVDLVAARTHGITVTNVPAYSPPAIAELALLMLLALNRKLPTLERRAAQHDYRWAGVLGREIRSQTIGVIGVGRIGSVFARFCRGLGAHVVGYDIAPNHELDDAVEFVDSLEELLSRADVVSVHTPLDDSTRGMIDTTFLAALRPGAIVINCARGPIVEPDALVSALEAGHLGGVGLDVMPGEDGIFDAQVDAARMAGTLFGRLAGRDDVVLTPHIAFYTDTGVANMLRFGLDNALAAGTGDPRPDGAPVDAVN